MGDAIGPKRPSRPLSAHDRRVRRRELKLAEDRRLILNPDGSIGLIDGEGTTKQSWTPDDPEWARYAIRFGLRPVGSTIPPRGRYVEPTKPPRR